jgi:hypothetical protein
VVTIGAGITLIGTFLTWVRSGATERSSYEVFDLVDRLGFSPEGAVGWALRLWPLVPVLLVFAVVATWLAAIHWRSSAGAVALVGVSGVYAGATAASVAAAPEAGDLLGIGPGPAVTLAGVVLMFVGAVLSVVHRPDEATRTD